MPDVNRTHRCPASSPARTLHAATTRRTAVSVGAAILALGLACSDPDGDDPVPSGSTGAQAATGSDGTSTGVPPVAESGDASSDGADTTAGLTDDGSSTGAPLQSCGLEDLKPGTATPIDAGLRAGQLPPDIATALEANCGCHLADNLTVEGVPDYPGTGAFDLSSWDGFQTVFGADDMPYYTLAETYLQSDTMPLGNFCNLGGGLAIEPGDKMLLLDWLAADAPDGATWMP